MSSLSQDALQELLDESHAREDALQAEVERLTASVERTARAFRACEQGRKDEAELHRAEVERERALRVEAVRDNRDKTEAVRELQAQVEHWRRITSDDGK